MKKSYNKILFAATAIILIVICYFFTSSTVTAHGLTSEEKKYSFYFKNYDAVYDIESNRKMTVTETLTIEYTGTENTGFIKTIPVNGGEMVKNVKASEISTEGKEISVPYDVYTYQDDGLNNVFCVDIGSGTNKSGETHTYKVKYDYCIPYTEEEGKNTIKLNVIGVDRLSYCHIQSANVTILLPDGYTDGKCFTGTLLSENTAEFSTETVDGRTILKLTEKPLLYNEGVTFTLNFKDGALTTYFDFTPFWFAIAGVAVLLVLLIIKLAFFNKNSILPVVNFEAPENLDPLLMGKLIDNTVNTEDITSMLFYWADKGYIKINLEKKDDPVLIKIVRELPDSCADYEKVMFNSLFGIEDAVRTSSLTNRFYITVNKITAMVNSRAKHLYDGKSMGVSLIFAIIGGLLPGLAPFILAIANISFTYAVFAPFIAIVPALIIYGLCETVKYNSLKFKTAKKALYCGGIALLCIACIAVYTILAPSWLMSYLQKAVIATVSCLISACSVLLVCRTKEYTEKLNLITGFKNFITLTEKDKLEKMLESDPMFFYHILPYAQVLGVSDIWENKFKDITMEPPHWCVSSVLSGVIRVHIINSLLKNSMSRMSSAMVTKPSSSGSSGFGGFGGGGHVGGGHGGGGFRGR